MAYLCAMPSSVALHTLGCKLNFSETTALGRMLEQDGFVQKDFRDIADVYVINTCSVTENADKECRQLVRRIQRKAPEAMVVITGCYAQLKPTEIASIPGVNLVLGAAEKFNISQHLRELKKNDTGKICSCDIDEVTTFTASHSVHERTRVFLKVQDGCDYNCSFCTIPLARGKSRSDTIEHVLEEVEQIAQNGAKEIVLTGINLGDFGKGTHGGKKHETSFFDLIKALEETSPISRIRISSIEPNLLTLEMISFIASSTKFMPHFHMPLQSGSNKLLGLMRRRYVRELYAERVAWINHEIPHACIGADVIVGFPGETDEDFAETARFIESLDIAYLHVFTYSERDNTLAADMPDVVPMFKRNERNKILRNLSYRKMQAFTEKHRGQTRPVLFESVNKNGLMEGYTDNYLHVSVPYKKEWENTVVEWVV
ncbi:MAG: tRNA (N(6)-L-threonylcarbamoyladenosine(37)-C(2))-methylthiotransferase MtaB [Ferruginibacter sp.]